jgi:hypothetical protein
MDDWLSFLLIVATGIVVGVATCPETLSIKEWEQGVELCTAHMGVSSVSTRHSMYITATCKDSSEVTAILNRRRLPS